MLRPDAGPDRSSAPTGRRPPRFPTAPVCSPAVQSTPRVRWGLGDFVWVWPVVLFGQVVGLSLAVGLRGLPPGHRVDAWDIAATTVASTLVTLGALALVARLRGTGTLRRDFGLVVRGRDWPWLLVGVGLQVVALVLVQALDRAAGGLPAQDVAKAIERSGSTARVAGALAVVTLAPLGEELLFRGLLLRGLLRRCAAPVAVTIGGFAFAAVHLLDPNAAPFLAPLALVGMVSGMRAVRTGELSQSILLHAGFNLLTAVLLVAGTGT